MEKLKVLRANSTESAFGYEDNTSNYGVLVPTQFLKRLRNTVLIDLHTRRSVQDRPSYYFYGAAEHIMLSLMSNGIIGGVSTPMQLLFDTANTTGGLSRLLGLGRSKPGVASIAQMFTNILPSLTTPGVYDLPQSGGKPNSSYDVFSKFMLYILQDPKTRENVFKTVSRPTYTIQNPLPNMSVPPNMVAIQDMITKLELYGMSGKRQPLFAESVDPILAMRFNVEDYLFADAATDRERDDKFSAAIWYLMYAQIVRTPESYDATFPSVPVSPQDGVVASHILSTLGSITQTSFSAATAPLYVDLLLSIRVLEETVEFLQTGPHMSDDLISDIKKILGQARGHITDVAYAPVISYSNVLVDYLKKLTGARYLLPDFLASWESLGLSKPFAPLSYTPVVDVGPNYRGAVPNLQRVTEFGGLDIPRLLMDIKRRALDCTAQSVQYKHIYDTYYSGLAMPRGSVITHLDTLGSLPEDPRLGVLEYPSPTSVYVTPSYVPKYVSLASGKPQWSLESSEYKLIFPVGFQLDKIKNQLSAQEFAWDTSVHVPASPTTGADFACLLFPHNYVEDCTYNAIDNTIAAVGHFISGSKHRPMAEIADFFTPLFHALLTGLTKPDVIANAVSSMFFIYKRTKKSKGSFKDVNDWDIVSPTVPFIYGYPTSQLIDANAPWGSSYPCEPHHVHFSSKGDYMIVLHRALPKPSALSYVPFTMSGTVRLSIPVLTTIYTAARAKVISAKPQSADQFYSLFFKELSNQRVNNSLLRVERWAPTFGFFPHLFVTNRHVTSMAASAAEAIPLFLMRRTLTTDKQSMLAAVLSYIEMPIYAFDFSDEFEAYASSDTVIDINEDLEKKKAKGSVNKAPEAMPVAKLEEVEVVNKTNEVPISTAEHTNATTGQTVTEPVPVKEGANLSTNSEGEVTVS